MFIATGTSSFALRAKNSLIVAASSPTFTRDRTLGPYRRKLLRHRVDFRHQPARTDRTRWPRNRAESRSCPVDFFKSIGWPSTSVVVNAGAGWPSSGCGGSSGSRTASSAFSAAGGVNVKSASVNFGATFQSRKRHDVGELDVLASHRSPTASTDPAHLVRQRAACRPRSKYPNRNLLERIASDGI